MKSNQVEDEPDNLTSTGKEGGDNPCQGERELSEKFQKKRQDNLKFVKTKTLLNKTNTGSVRSKIIMVAMLAVIVLIGGYGYQWWTYHRYIVSTNDAYIKADKATLATKVSGYISAITVSDNTRLKAGDVIARIDDGDYRLAVQAAQDRIDLQKATIERTELQIKAQEATVDQARARLTSAEANAKRAKAELERQRGLERRNFASRKTLDEAIAGNSQAEADVKNAVASVSAALAMIEVVKAQKKEAFSVLKQLETSLAKAKRDLSFTIIRAPFTGVIGNRAVQVGDYVQTGQRFANLVRLDEVYIDANFKETQLANLKAGQPVDVHVDAVPDRTFCGRIASFSPASGAEFSLLPPDNATGNFTKVVQRIPVRILVAHKPGDRYELRPGMSVVVNVNTKPMNVKSIKVCEVKNASLSR